jgi:hypothetical protein
MVNRELRGSVVVVIVEDPVWVLGDLGIDLRAVMVVMVDSG